ncbi:AAEL002082-PA, partial [Aedes aegypti]
MDFGKLLSVAQRNATNSEQKSSESRYYSTKFAPPKKESKDKKLSANIQKFLAKKEEEERQKALEEKRKRDELMAKRDPKAKKKIEKMLKVIKSANKSVLDDAIDQNDTAVTLQGPEQPDEDDYGYTSNVASQLYQQLMDKYKNTPEEKKFKDGSKRVMSKEDMERAKARVKDALNRVEEEENAPRTRKRKDAGEGSTRDEESASGSSKKLVGPDRYDPEEERRKEAETKAKEEAAKKKARRPAGPAPPDFATLLKLAEQKQMEPVKVEVPVVEKKKEPERLMTKKEKKEYEERQAYLEQKRIRDRIRNDPPGKVPPSAGANKSGPTSTNVMTPNGRIPKLNSSAGSSEKPSTAPPKPTSSTSRKPPSSAQSSSASREPSSIKKPVPSSQQNGAAKISSTAKPSPQSSAKPTPSSTANGQKTRPFPPADVPQKTRQFPPPDVQKTRQFPPPDVQKTRQFPPPDVMRKRPLDARGKPSSSAPMKKRRPVIEDSDSEYDSEMDDFIDDGDEEMDYSSQIKAIFGYDKSRYRDEDFDDREMESTFAQQMREEFISKKIGLMEDLEDMRMEEEEKRMKALKKKQAAKR